MKILALDFDGVLSDSAPECFVVGLRAYLERTEGSTLSVPVDFLVEGFAPARERVEGDALYARFLDLMPLGNRAEDFGIAFRALESGTAIRDQAGYDAFRSGLSEDWQQAYHERFYELRGELSRGDPSGWEQLMGTFPQFLSVLLRRQGDATLAIATAKDRSSVERLLRSYGIADLFPAERVLDKETGVSKVTHLRNLMAREGVEATEITFVDDKVNHLDSTASLGVRCALATWGYNGAREIEIARERGYLICTLDDVEEQLFDA